MAERKGLRVRMGDGGEAFLEFDVTIRIQESSLPSWIATGSIAIDRDGDIHVSSDTMDLDEETGFWQPRGKANRIRIATVHQDYLTGIVEYEPLCYGTLPF